MDPRSEKLKQVIKIIQDANPNLNLNFLTSFHGNTGENFWIGCVRIDDPLTKVNFPSLFGDIQISHPCHLTLNCFNKVNVSITTLYAKYNDAEITYSVTPGYTSVFRDTYQKHHCF